MPIFKKWLDKQYFSHSAAETIFSWSPARKSIPDQHRHAVLFGELAAGKTTFIKGLVHGAAAN